MHVAEFTLHAKPGHFDQVAEVYSDFAASFLSVHPALETVLILGDEASGIVRGIGVFTDEEAADAVNSDPEFAAFNDVIGPLLASPSGRVEAAALHHYVIVLGRLRLRENRIGSAGSHGGQRPRSALVWLLPPSSGEWIRPGQAAQLKGDGGRAPRGGSVRDVGQSAGGIQRPAIAGRSSFGRSANRRLADACRDRAKTLRKYADWPICTQPPPWGRGKVGIGLAQETKVSNRQGLPSTGSAVARARSVARLKAAPAPPGDAPLAADRDLLSKAVLEASVDCVIAIDTEGRIVEWNPAAERTFGYSRAEALGSELARMVIPPAERRTQRRSLLALAANPDVPLADARHVRMAMDANGNKFPIELTLARLDGPPPLLVGFVREVRDQDRMRRQRETARRRQEAIPRSAIRCFAMPSSTRSGSRSRCWRERSSRSTSSASGSPTTCTSRAPCSWSPRPVTRTRAATARRRFPPPRRARSSFPTASSFASTRPKAPRPRSRCTASSRSSSPPRTSPSSSRCVRSWSARSHTTPTSTSSSRPSAATAA